MSKSSIRRAIVVALGIISLVLIIGSIVYAVSDTALIDQIAGFITISSEDGDDMTRYVPLSQNIDNIIRDVVKFYSNNNDPVPNIVCFTKDKGEGRDTHKKAYSLHWDDKLKIFNKTDYFIPGEKYMVIHDPERLWAVNEYVDEKTGNIIVQRYHKLKVGFNNYHQKTASIEGVGSRTVAKDTTYIEKKVNGEILKQILNFPIIHAPTLFITKDEKEAVTAFTFSFNTEGANREVPGLGLISTTDNDPVANSYCLRCQGMTWEETCGKLWLAQLK